MQRLTWVETTITTSGFSYNLLKCSINTTRGKRTNRPTTKNPLIALGLLKMLRYCPKRWVFFFAIKMVITDSSCFVATGNLCLMEFLSLKIGSWKAGVKYTCRMWQSNLWALKWLKSTGFTWLYPACLKGFEGYPTCWWITFIATNPHSLFVYPYVCRSVPPGTPISIVCL